MSLEKLQRLSIGNRDAIEASENCGCYFCIRVFRSLEIIEYADHGKTALCPQCNVDAILPGVTDKALLNAMCERWFTASAASQGTSHA